MIKASSYLVLAGAVALTGCVSQEQIAKNKERFARIDQGASFDLQGCETIDGKNTCFEEAKAQCEARGQIYHWMYQTRGQAKAGNGAMTVKCVPPVKET